MHKAQYSTETKKQQKHVFQIIKVARNIWKRSPSEIDGSTCIFWHLLCQSEPPIPYPSNLHIPGRPNSGELRWTPVGFFRAEKMWHILAFVPEYINNSIPTCHFLWNHSMNWAPNNMTSTPKDAELTPIDVSTTKNWRCWDHQKPSKLHPAHGHKTMPNWRWSGLWCDHLLHQVLLESGFGTKSSLRKMKNASKRKKAKRTWKNSFDNMLYDVAFEHDLRLDNF